MPRKSSLGLILILFFLVAGQLLAQNQDAPLSNRDIVAMVKAGLAQDVLIAKIKNSICNFDTSTDALITLKAANVPGDVIRLMVETPTGRVGRFQQDASASSSFTRTTVPEPQPKDSI